jgi:hypothetical protein
MNHRQFQPNTLRRIWGDATTVAIRRNQPTWLSGPGSSFAQLSLIHVKNAVPFANTRDTNVRQVALIVSSELALQFERLAHNPCLSEFPNTSLTRLFYLARKKLVCSPIVCVHLRDPKVIRRRSPNVDCLVLHRTRDSAIYCKGFNRR